MSRLWAWILLSAPLIANAQPLAPEVLLLAKIKRHMETVLSRLPNYTCRETIERSRREAKSKKFRLVDALQLEVAVVEGKELFSWPGEREFKDRDLRELAPTGAIGNGSFALHARSVFLSQAPTIVYHGEEESNGRKAHRYDFTVPQFRSGYRIRINELEGIAGYRGSFWTDAESLDLIQLDVETVDIPPYLPLKRSQDSMRYERVAIGESTFLLPKSSEMVIEDFYGGQSRNAISFASCRQYAGESTLSFDEAPESSGVPAALPEAISLPPGLLAGIELRSRVRFPGGAMGDEIEGRLVKDIKVKGTVVAPKGAILKGNVALIERRKDFRGMDMYVVALQWREIAFDGKVGPFEGQLDAGGAIPISEYGGRTVYQRPSQVELKRLPHRDAFYVRKDTLDLPRGLLFYWRTRRVEGSGTQKP